MLIDRSHRRWIVATIALTLGAGAIYVVSARGSLEPPGGGSLTGLAFGGAAAALFVFCALLGVRRKMPTVRIGSAQSWLRAHIWLGLLTVPLVAFHAGFRVGGPLALALVLVFAGVIASGLYGLLAQQLIPRSMTRRVPMETIYEQIDRVLEQLVEEADRAVAAVAGELFVEGAPVGAHASKGEGPPKRRGKPVQPLPMSEDLRAFHLESVRPFLCGRAGGPLGTRAERAAIFETTRISLPPPLHPTVRALEEICEERAQLLEQRRLHHWLHGWLFAHLPLTFALLVLTAVHAVMALRY